MLGTGHLVSQFRPSGVALGQAHLVFGEGQLVRFHQQRMRTGIGSGQLCPEELALGGHVIVGEQNYFAVGQIRGEPFCVGMGNAVLIVIDHRFQIPPGQYDDDPGRRDLEPDV